MRCLAVVLALATVAVGAAPAAAATPAPSASPRSPGLASEATASPPLTVEPLRIGRRWRGRLPGVGDEAELGFTLRTAEHLSLHVGQPKDADVEVAIATGGRELLRQRALRPGTTIVLELWLTAGDHILTLRSTRPSDRRYRLLVLRQDPFVVPADSEPNDDPALARQVPASLRWDGGPAGAEPDLDGFWLPPLSAPGDARIIVTGERPVLRLFSDAARTGEIPLVVAGEDVLVASDAPTGRPLYLEVEAEAPYGLELDAAGWAPVEDPLAPPVEVELELAVPEGFTCDAEGASLPLGVTIVNVGAMPLELDLRTASSDPAWRLVLDTDSVRVDPGMTITTDASVDVLPGGCDHLDPALSVAAVAVDGGLVSTTLTLDPGALTPDAVLVAAQEVGVDLAP